jgi:hypothetical protein
MRVALSEGMTLLSLLPLVLTAGIFLATCRLGGEPTVTRSRS